MNFFEEQIKKIIENNLYRKLNIIEKTSGSTITMGGKEYINFGSNDYFGISREKKILAEGRKVLEEFGSNICSAQTLCGHSIHHRNLIDSLKRILGIQDEVLLFSSGYLANLAIFQVFPRQDSEIFMDIFSHRSLIDGARLSGIKLFFYRHRDYEYLKSQLKNSKAKYKVIATDSIFSMEATMIDLLEIIEIKEAFDTFLVLDDAHGFMVLNNNVLDYFKIKLDSMKNLVYIATLSKSAGTLGGFMAGEKILMELVKNRAGTFLFDTALSPHICAMARASIDILTTDINYINKLYSNIKFLNLHLHRNDTKINVNEKNRKGSNPIPIFIKKYSDLDELNKVHENLLNNGIYVPAIRPPTVPQGESRLRISVSALHTKEDIEKLIEKLSKI